jgi:hypothetical protein
MSRRAFAFGALVLIPMLVLIKNQSTFAQSKPAAPASPAAVSKFVGTWKEDLSKRKGTIQQMLTFRRSASGGLEELRGSELRPLVQPVNFTGKPYAIDDSKNTIAWKQIDPNRFERAIYNAGRLLNTRRLQLSADGKTLTQETEAIGRAGDKTLNTIVYRRESGDQGLVGRWRAESSKSSTAPQVVYEAVGANAIKVTTGGGGNPNTVTATLDAKPVAVVGDAVISGTMTAVKAIDASTLEFTGSREGTVTDKSVRVVSPDGKMMTVTFTPFGPNASKEPVVSVFVKQ